MKQTIKLNETQLRQIVAESVKKVLKEEDFKYVDDLNSYVQQNNLPMKPASKFQRVNAQSGKKYIENYWKGQGLDKRQIGRKIRKSGAPLQTVASDGTKETNNLVTRNHTVLNNVGNADNKWAAETPTFKRKYVPDATKSGVFKPKGGPMNAAQVNEPISFKAPWGEQMNIGKGGYILQDPNNPNDIYGISQKDFDSSYRFDEAKINDLSLEKIVTESIKKVLKEMTPEYYAQQAQKAQNATQGLKGKMMKTFTPKAYNKIAKQGKNFQDMSQDHPDDTWQVTQSGWGNQSGDRGYHLTNQRTGMQKQFTDDAQNNGNLPIRGTVVNGQQSADNPYYDDANMLNGLNKRK